MSSRFLLIPVKGDDLLQLYSPENPKTQKFGWTFSRAFGRAFGRTVVGGARVVSGAEKKII